MSSWLNGLSRKKQPKTKQLWGRKFSLVEEGLDEEQIIAFVGQLLAHRETTPVPTPQSEQTPPPDAIRSIIERAVTDAEQLAASIKTRAQQEAVEEAAKIIGEAKQKADEIRRQTEMATKEETGDILEELNTKARLIEEEAKQRVESLLLQVRQEIGKEVKEEYKEAHAKLLRSLMKGAEVALPSAETPASVRIELKTGIAVQGSGDKLTKEDAKRKSEKAREKRNAVGTNQGKPSWLEQIGLRKKGQTKPASVNEDKTREKAEEAQKNKTPSDGGKPWWKLEIGSRKKAALEAAPSAKKNEETEQPSITQTETVQKEPNPVQPSREAPLPKAAEPAARRPSVQPRIENKPDNQEPVGVPQKLDKEAIYEGEIELAIAVPVDPAAVSKLYNYLQSTPDMKILYTRGSWDRGTTIAVTLDKPLPFIGMISKISGLTIAPGLPQKENLVKGTSGSLLGAKRKEVAKIDLILKAE